jgi:hypothetical protein
LHIGWHLVVSVRWRVLVKSTFSHFLPRHKLPGRDKNVKIRLMAQHQRGDNIGAALPPVAIITQLFLFFVLFLDD